MDKKNTKEATTAASTEHTNTKPPETSHSQTVQNFLIVWLDPNVDPANDDYQNMITKLREITNAVNIFNDVDKCISFIGESNEKKVFTIFSGALGEKIVPIVHDMAQVSTIFIFCVDKTRHQQWAQRYPKIKGVFTDFKPIFEDLKKGIQKCDQNTVSTSLVATSGDTKNENLDQLDSSFMYTQVLKEILLSINFESQQFMKFITFCREQFRSNPVELKNVDKIEREYRRHTPIWWYTYDCFLYSMVNSALRTMDVDLIIDLGFLIRDLHEHIARLHSEQYAGHHHANSFVVYFSQDFSQNDFDQLMKIQGGLLAFNQFLLTNKNRQVSLNFARETMKNSDMVGILFVMTIDPSISSTPFADVRGVSYHQKEEEILFSMHSIFRIGKIQKLDENNRLWEVNLTLTTDSDPELHFLTERIREETLAGENGWCRLGKLLMKMGQSDKAQQVYEMVLTHTTDEREKANIYYQLGWAKYDEGDYVEAIRFYEKSLEIKQKTLPPNHPDLATSYGNIGSVYYDMGDYSKALSYHEKNLEIYQKTLPANHPNLASSYGNIGSVYEKLGEYSKALSYYERNLEIYQKTLPTNHPDLASSYSNIGSVYENMSEYSKARSYYEKALEIKQKSLPPNHPNMTTSYASLAAVYLKMSDYSKALSFYERALDIGQRSLPESHPELQLYKKNIESIKKKL